MRRGEERRLQQWLCNTCETDIGVATSAAVEMRHTLFVDVATGQVSRKMAGKQLVCAYCLGRGKITEVI